MEDKGLQFYEYVKSKGVSVPDSFEEFQSGLENPDTAAQFMKYLSTKNIKTPGSVTEFQDVILNNADIPKKDVPEKMSFEELMEKKEKEKEEAERFRNTPLSPLIPNTGKREGEIDFFDEAITDIDKDFIGETESFVVPELKYRFKDYGFTFEETGMTGDYVTVTAHNRESEEFSLENLTSGANSEESLKLKSFLLKNRASEDVEAMKRIEARQAYETKRFINQEQVELATKSLNDDMDILVSEEKDLYNVYQEISTYGEKFEGLTQGDLDDNPELKADYDSYKARVDEFQSMSDVLKNKRGDLIDRRWDLKQSVGAYVNMKEEQGQFGSKIINNILLGIGDFAAQEVDLMTEGLVGFSETGGAGSREYTRLMLEEAYGEESNVLNDFLVNVPKPMRVGSFDKNDTDTDEEIKTIKDHNKSVTKKSKEELEKIKSSVTPEEYNRMEAAVEDKLKKGLKYGKDGRWKGGMLDNLQTGLVELIGSGGLSEEYMKRKEGTVTEALQGTARSLPGMISGLTGGVPGKAMTMVMMASQQSMAVKEEMANDPNFDDVSELERTAIVAPIAIVGGVLESFGVRNLQATKGLMNGLIRRAFTKSAGKQLTAKSFERIIRDDIKSGLTRGALKLTGAGLAEAETGAAQEFAEVGMKKIYNYIKDEEKFETATGMQWIQDIAMAGLQEAIGGFVLGSPGAVVTGLSNTYDEFSNDLPDTVYEAFNIVIGDPNIREGYIASINAQVADGSLTREEADEKIKTFKMAGGIAQSIPSDMRTSEKKQAFKLLYERQVLESSIEGKDKSLTKKEQKEIDEINKKIEALKEKSIKRSTKKEKDFEASNKVIEGINKKISELREKLSDTSITKKEKNSLQKELASLENDLKIEKDKSTETDKQEATDIESFFEGTEGEDGPNFATNSGGKSQVLSDKQEAIVNKIKSRVEKVANSLKSRVPGVRILLHENADEYKRITGKSGGGAYIIKDGKGTIHINLSKARASTLAHEAFHAVFLHKLKTDSNAARAAIAMVKSVEKVLDPNSQLAKDIKAFSALYKDKGEGIQNEEKLAELVGRISSEYKTLSRSSKDKVIDLLKKLANKIGFKFEEDFGKSDQDVIDLLNTLARKFESGEEITEEDVDVLDKDIEILEPYTDGFDITIDPNAPMNPQPRESKNIYNDIPFAENLPIVSMSDFIKKVEGRIFGITSDATKIGYDTKGDKIDGGFGYSAIKENIINKIGFASLDVKTATGTLGKIKKRYKPGEKIGIIIMVQNPSATVGNFYGGKYLGRGLLTLKNESPESYQEVINGFVELLENKSIATEMNKNTADKQGLINLISNPEKYNETEFAAEWIKDTTFNARRTILESLLIDNNDVKTNKSTNPTKLKLKNAGFNTLDFLMEYGDVKLLGKNNIKNNIGGFAVGGFEMIVPEDTKKSAVDASNRGLIHPQFNGKIPSNGNAFIFDGLYSMQENFVEFATKETRISNENLNEANIKVRRKFKDDKFYKPEFISGKNKVSNENRGYKHLKSAFKIEFKKSNPELLVNVNPSVVANIARGMGFSPDSKTPITKDAEFTTQTREQRTERLAPNGNQSNLNDIQYDNVRTPAFKKWFGDWENDPKNASKVVDENGEPLVVYHGTGATFDAFDKKIEAASVGASNGFQGFFFTQEEGRAGDFAIAKEERIGGDAKTIPVFLSIKNPSIADAKGSSWVNIYPEQIERAIKDKNDGAITKNIKDAATSISYWQNKEDNNYIAFEPNQIKLADGSNKTFDPDAPSIREQRTERLAPNGNQSNLSDVQYDAVRTPTFKKWFGDWENDPKNASKVVDENGEPLVVYHGSASNFDEFKIKDRSVGRRKTSIKGHYFTTSKWVARQYAGSDGYIKDYFIKILNTPKKSDDVVSDYTNIDDFLFDYGKKITELGYDGAIDNNGDYVVLEPNQIKLADGSNTTFDPDAPSIREDRMVESPSRMTAPQIILEARQNNFSDAAIRDYLIRVRGYSVKQVDEALKFDIDAFESLPQAFRTITGGVVAGLRLYNRVKAYRDKITKANNKLKNPQLSESEIKAKVAKKLAELKGSVKYGTKTNKQIDDDVRKFRSKEESNNKKRKTKLTAAQVNDRVRTFREKLQAEKQAKIDLRNKAITNFEKTERKANEKRKPRMSEQEIMDKAIEFLEKQPEYLAERETYTVGSEKEGTKQTKFREGLTVAQASLVSAFQSNVGVRPTKSVAEKLKKARRMLRDRKKGAIDLNKIKNELRHFIRRSLPNDLYKKTEVLKLIKLVTDANEGNIENIFEQVEKRVTEMNNKTLIQKISKMLDLKQYAKKDRNGKIIKGRRIDPETLKRLEGIVANLIDPSMDVDELVKAVEERVDSLQKQIDELNSKEELSVEDMTKIVDLNIAMQYNQSLLLENDNIYKTAALDNVHNSLGEIITFGRAVLQDRINKRHKSYVEQLERAYYDITGNKIDMSQEGAKEELAEMSRGMRNKAKKDRVDRRLRGIFQKLKSSLNGGIQDLSGYMNIISTLPGEMFEGEMQDMVTDTVDASTRMYKGRMLQIKEVLETKLREIYGSGWEKEIQESRESIEETEAILGYQLSRDEIIYLYNQYRDPSNHSNFEAQYGGKYAEKMEKLFEFLTKEDKEFADYQVNELFPSLYEYYNPIYKRIYDAEMPWSMVYAGPLRYDGGTETPFDLLQGTTSFQKSMAPGYAIKRVNNKRKISEESNINNMTSYIQEMEYWAAYAENLRDINKLFKNDAIRDAITSIHGPKLMKLIDESIDVISKKGGKVSEFDRIVNGTNSLFSITRLALSPVIYLKQLTSAFAYANDIGYRNWVKYSIKNIIEFRKLSKEIMENSIYLKDRYDKSITRTLETYKEENSIFTRPKYFIGDKGISGDDVVSFMMGLVTAGDRHAIIIGGMPNYKLYKDRYMKENPEATEQEAVDYAIIKFEKDTKKAQQSSDLQDKDLTQTGNPIYRSFNMFLTSPKQYLRKELYAIRQIYTKIRQWDRMAGKGTVGQNLRTLTTFHVVLPMIFQYVTSGLPGLLADWEDEDGEDLLRAAIMGNINGLFILGDFFVAAADYAQDKPWAFDFKNLTVYDIMGEIGDSVERYQKLKPGPKKEEAYWTMIATIAQAKTIKKWVENLQELPDSKNVNEAIMRLLNYSEYQISGGKKSKKSAPKSSDKEKSLAQEISEFEGS